MTQLIAASISRPGSGQYRSISSPTKSPSGPVAHNQRPPTRGGEKLAKRSPRLLVSRHSHLTTSSEILPQPHTGQLTGRSLSPFSPSLHSLPPYNQPKTRKERKNSSRTIELIDCGTPANIFELILDNSATAINSPLPIHPLSTFSVLYNTRIPLPVRRFWHRILP